MNDSNHEQDLLARTDALMRQGQVKTAIAALEAGPADSADVQRNLAQALRMDGRHAEAVDALGRALTLGVDDAHELLLIRGVIQADALAKPEAAEADFRRALVLMPDYVPALFNLGSLLEDRGDRDGARAVFQEVTRLDPRNTGGLARLIGVCDIEGNDDSIVARVRSVIASPRTLMADRATLGFALGQALDSVGAYTAAFEAIEAANRDSRAGAGVRGVRYDRLGQERRVDRLIAAFPEPGPQPSPMVMTPDPSVPVFICGMFRSGSTLVERILGAHSKVVAGGELDLLPSLIRHELPAYPEQATDLAPEVIERLRDLYLDGVRSRFPGAAMVTDKRPDNFLHMGLIKRLFPTARIVHTRRDPLDNCLSIYFLHLTLTMPYALDLIDTAHWLGQHNRLMVHWRRLYEADILDVSYDELVRAPRETIQRVLAFCGLPWEEACMDFHKSGGVVRTASLWQVRQPLYQKSSGRWRNYEGRLDALRAALACNQVPTA